MKDESWGGVYVDLIDQEIADRSHINIVMQHPCPPRLSTTGTDKSATNASSHVRGLYALLLVCT